MGKYLTAVGFVVLGVIAISPAATQAESATTTATSTATSTTSTNISNLLAQLQTLMVQVEKLQKQLAVIKGEIRVELKDGLKEGMQDDDIKKIQELLATDPSIYPKGITSGYYGPLTREAIMRFQERHGLEVSGIINDETKELMKEYFKERQNGKFPSGLLKAPGISKKILERWKMKDGEMTLDCDDKKAAGPLCKKDKKDKKEKMDDDKASSTDKMVVSTTTVNRAVEQAKLAIKELKVAVNSATSSNARREAVEHLTEAERLLAAAEKDLLASKLRSAHERAVQAEKVAKRALAKLLDKEMDDDDDDDDDEDEDN